MRAAEGLGPRLARQGGRAMRNDPAMAGSLLIYFSYSLIVSLPGCESQQGPEGPPMGESAFRRPIFAALSPLRGMCSGAAFCASLMGELIFTRPLSALCLHSGSDVPQSGAVRRCPALSGAVRRCPALSGAVTPLWASQFPGTRCRRSSFTPVARPRQRLLGQGVSGPFGL